MKTDTSIKLITYIKSRGEVSPTELVSFLKVSPQAVHRHLKNLVANGTLVKIGSAPRVLYKIASLPDIFPKISPQAFALLEQEFSFLSPSGDFYRGLLAFNSWIKTKKLDRDYVPLTNAYVKAWATIYGQRKSTPIETLARLRTILPHMAIESAYISDFYALPQFGKTILGNLIHVAKTAFRQEYAAEICAIIQHDIHKILSQHRIDAVLFCPHSVPRKMQLLPALKKILNLPVPHIVARKIFAGNVPVAQKTLAKLDERIENARSTVHIQAPEFRPKNVLILDDAIGSGATVNEIAALLKTKFGVSSCHAYAIVGSYKGFDVISAV
jgi:biotin operon repressor